MKVLRHGGMPRLFDGVRSPSTIGTYPRNPRSGMTWPLDAVAAQLLAGLTGRVPGLIRGGTDTDGIYGCSGGWD